MKILLLCWCVIFIASSVSAADEDWLVVLGETRQEGRVPSFLQGHNKRWQTVLREYARDSREEKNSLTHLPRASLPSRLNLEKVLPGMKPLEKVAAISGFINFQAKSASDMELYGIPEKWAAPAEFFRHARGDCEDYAIAKYFVLREKGFSADDLRLLIVKEGGNVGHMLLAVLIDGHIYIVDNNSRPQGLILRQNEQLSRYYNVELAFNENGVWWYK
jgi:predicted transglutaminase-like cysteine proteinase